MAQSARALAMLRSLRPKGDHIFERVLGDKSPVRLQRALGVRKF